ncbi:MAG: hypothetical protein P8Q43_07615 [Ulvibacter sp.]|nr:hypothetical protein [Ulvibacter sp.]
MNTQNYTLLLADPQQITKQALPDLVEVIDAYPYFQSARALWLKGLKNQESFRYNDALKLTAAHTTNRDILFEFITSETFEQDHISLQILSNDQAIGQYDIEIGEDLSQTIDTEQKQEQKQALEDAEAVLDPNLFEKKIADIEQMIAVSQEFSNKEDASNTAGEKQAASNQLGIDSPLAFSKKDRHSFSQWLQLTTATPIVREEIKEEKLPQTTKEKEHKNDLIEKFINEKPKIKSLKNSPQQQNTTQEDSKPSNSLMTETLAKVYLQQKNYKKAIQAYKILILKNPEKSGFFADQIRAVEKLINTEAP